MAGIVRSLYYNLLLLPGIPDCFKYAQRNSATILMLHRFRDNERGVEGLDPSNLRKGLAYLRRHRYELVSLTDIFDRLGRQGRKPNGAVAFTIDDGYRDQAEVAAPVFREFDCPVTTFVTTGFLDGHIWFWWDQIDHIFRQTRQNRIKVEWGDRSIVLHWTNTTERAQAQMDFTEDCKKISEEDKRMAIARLAEQAEVDVPKQPPTGYQPMTWEQARSCEQGGMMFGPHTVTHPILSQTSAGQATYEIAESWTRLCQEVRRPVPVFCYPNGRRQDFGTREIAVLRELGFLGAVVGELGFGDSVSFRERADGPFIVKRLEFPETIPRLVQYVSGIERCKQVLRGEA